MAHYRITNLTHVGNSEEITLEKIPGAIASFFGAKTETLEFHGSGTVWHQVPTGLRPGTTMESLITDLVAWHKIHATPAPQ
jgi:hypothetical protein